MNKFTCLALFLLFFLVVTDTKAQADSTKSDSIYTTASEEPSFIGDYVSFLQQNMLYPSAALDKNIEGKVGVSFIVEKNGTITDIQIIQSVHPSLDEETLNIARLTSGKWKPAIQNNNIVRYKKIIKVSFVMPSDKKKKEKKKNP